MKSIVITQPMLFPWVGLFEQLKLADTVVFYDDVQFSKGSFTNRVQLKSTNGPEWMTIPLRRIHLGQQIKDTFASDNIDWRSKHITQLQNCYASADYYDDVLELVGKCYQIETQSLCELSIHSMIAIIDYYNLCEDCTIVRSSELVSSGNSTQRVLDIVLELGCDTYVTGHGASKYLDHQLFENNGISVQYMDYQMLAYSQLHGAFTPYVSILDLIANHGKEGIRYLKPATIHWAEFIHERN